MEGEEYSVDAGDVALNSCNVAGTIGAVGAQTIIWAQSWAGAESDSLDS